MVKEGTTIFKSLSIAQVRMVVSKGACLKHYKRPEIQEALIVAGQGREVAVRYGDGFGKRPDVLQYPSDIMAFVKNGATSFHVSEESWYNPLQLTTGQKRSEMDELRSGWDLLIDIDCPWLVYSQLAAHVVVEFLKSKGISSIALKFSGNHGFHIGVPFEAFPEFVSTKQGDILVKNFFPEGPRLIANYMQDIIWERLSDLMLTRFSFATILQTTCKSREELITQRQGKAMFDPFKVLTIDTVLISSRHLYRMPYSFNEKSGLVSIPIEPSELLTFDKMTARPEVITTVKPFWRRQDARPEEASQLIIDAFEAKRVADLDAESRKSFLVKSGTGTTLAEVPETALSETLFPPCIAALQEGLVDGKKRALFMLVNFLASCGWSGDQLEQYVRAWNGKNKEPLSETILVGQLRYASQRTTHLMPPNCTTEGYYKDLGICRPDGLCAKIKNPVQYAKSKARRIAWVKAQEEQDIAEMAADREARKEERRREKEFLKEQERTKS